MISTTYRGIVRQVPLWGGDVVVEHFARNPLLCLSLPENWVEIRKVVVDIYAIIGPSTKRPTTELWTLSQRVNMKKMVTEMCGIRVMQNRWSRSILMKNTRTVQITVGKGTF